MLVCRFVGRKMKSEKLLRSSSLSRPINTARVRLLRADANAPKCTKVQGGYALRWCVLCQKLPQRTKRRTCFGEPMNERLVVCISDTATSIVLAEMAPPLTCARCTQPRP